MGINESPRVTRHSKLQSGYNFSNFGAIFFIIIISSSIIIYQYYFYYFTFKLCRFDIRDYSNLNMVNNFRTVLQLMHLRRKKCISCLSLVWYFCLSEFMLTCIALEVGLVRSLNLFLLADLCRLKLFCLQYCFYSLISLLLK